MHILTPEGFFGIIHRDSGAWRGFALTPRPTEAAELIQYLRMVLPTMPFEPGNEISNPPIGVAPDDIGTLGLLATQVFHPQNPDEQMIHATAIALLLDSPFFFIEGSAEPDGYETWLRVLTGPTAVMAHLEFSAYWFENYSGHA